MPENYDYPIIYKLVHIILGFIVGIKTPISLYLLISILIYQISQYLLNIRLFLLDKMSIEKGNSLKHTLNKLGEYMLGYILGILCLYIFNKNK